MKAAKTLREVEDIITAMFDNSAPEGQVRVIARIIERSQGQVIIDDEDKANCAPAVQIAFRPVSGAEHGTRDTGWKHYIVEPSGRSTLAPDG